MSETTRVDLHCHSTASDGALTPRDVAEQLVASGVAFASLTDHDSTEGLLAFREAALQWGIGVVPGLEMTARYKDEEAHLLAYGFDPSHEGLQAAIAAVRQTRASAVQTVIGSLRSRAGDAKAQPSASPAPHPLGRVDIAEAIDLVHQADGKAFLAHPLTLQPDADKLREIVRELREKGLDGVEAYYGPYTTRQQEALADLADECELLVCGGSDGHDRRSADSRGLGVAMPTARWRTFRDGIHEEGGPRPAAAPEPIAEPSAHRLRRRHLLFRVVFPTVLAIGLFMVAIFGIFLPTFQASLLDRKRETIRELTESAWSILAGFAEDVRAGRLSREQAQDMAAKRIGGLRYGPEGKDYFWLQDMHPRIVMHPYRPDLVGQDVSRLSDPTGARIFVEFAEVARRQGGGYVDYVWQWKDDPTRLAPKESYVKGFEPWGWVIGTGLYTDDVRADIARLQDSLLRASVVIAVLVAALLLYVMQQSLRLDRERLRAEEGLRESTLRYRSVVEAATEGTLLILDGRCRYANPTLLSLLRCSERELELLDLEDLLPQTGANDAAWEAIAQMLAGGASGRGFEGVLQRRDGRPIECALALDRMSFTGRDWLILLVRPVGRAVADSLPTRADASLALVCEDLPAGVFRARATSLGTVLYCSPSAERLLRPRGSADTSVPLTLAELFGRPKDYEELLEELRREGQSERRVHIATDELSTRIIALRTVLVQGEGGEPDYVDGIVEDVTGAERRDAEREGLVQRLQTNMLFLHEPIGQIRRSAVFCPLDASVVSVVAMMTAQEASAALVRSEGGDVVGIFTDHDLRERLIAAEADLRSPIRQFMTSPLVALPEDAEVYEALVAMEQHGINHVAVADDAGHIIGVIRGHELIQFPSYGPIVLAREVARAGSAGEVSVLCRRVPRLAKALLDSGAHAHRVTRMIGSTFDAATERLVALAQEKLGPAPAPFAFLALGSHGRQEQVLSSDQDNALIYRPPIDATPEMADYFLELGRQICGWLDEAGYRLCKGGAMAENPKWCLPLSAWRKTFSEWISVPEPERLLELSVFLDFRPVCGDAALADELRRHVHAEMRRNRSFLIHLADLAREFRPPRRLFGRLLPGGRTGEAPGQLNLKDALAPIMMFARLYALRHGLECTHTRDRLDALGELGVLNEASHEETVGAYDFLMRLRLAHQTEAVATGEEPDNTISLRRLDHAEEVLLNQSFAQIAAIQERIAHDFGASG